MYQGKPGYNRLAADLAAEYLRLRGETGCFIPYNNIRALLTIGPSGSIYDLQLTKPDEQEKKALRATYGDAVPQSESNELPATGGDLLVLAAQHLPRLTPAYASGQRVPIRLQLTLLAPTN